jgi:glutathione S-transferase
LEELGAPYEIKAYERDAMTRLAPAELKAVHPLGKSPVITHGDVTVAESGAIIEYLVDQFDRGELKPKAGTPAAIDYIYWMHFAEGSAMLPLMLALYTGLLGEAAAPLQPRIVSEIHNHLAYMEGRLKQHDYFVGDRFTAADVQMSFVCEVAAVRGFLRDYPALSAYLTKLQARPAYLRAIEKGGPYSFGPSGEGAI